MPTPLRAFLMLRNDRGDWHVEVARDLEQLVRTWEQRSSIEPMTAVVQIGFERSLARNYDAVTSQYPHRVILTAAAKHALPRAFRSSSVPVGEVDDQSVYLATTGWGYEIEDPIPQVLVPQMPHETPTASFKGWLSDLVARYSECGEILLEAGIVDEASYLAKEEYLEPEFRKQLGLARYQTLIQSNDWDPCAIAKAAPPWLLEREFAGMNLRVRITNVFVANNIRTVRDLAGYTFDELRKLPSLGRTSVFDLLETLTSALEYGPSDAIRREVAAAQVPLLQSVRQSLLNYGARERDIICRRMGLNGSVETLAEIGDSYGVSRERIRQIEAKTLIHLRQQEIWDDLLSEKLTLLLRNREFPLPMLGMEAIDPWFSGIAAAPDALRYILSNICGKDVELIEVDGILYVSFLSQQRWDTTLQDARRLLASGVDQAWTKTHCRSIVSALLPLEAAEFRSLLWDKASNLCHFSTDDMGEQVLQSYGRGAEQVVEAILQDADEPLHYSKIFERVQLRGKHDVDIRRVHNAAAAVGHLLGSGTYGLNKHLSLTQQELSAIAEQAEAIVLDGPRDRQWHVTELLIDLIEAGFEPALKCDKYLLDVALKQHSDLRSLGRFVWSLDETNGSEQRIEVAQAVVALVRQAGRPLRGSEIKQRLIAIRGMGEHIQLNSWLPLIRVGPSKWGLLDRDIPLTPQEQLLFVDAIVTELLRRGVGIHATEFWDVIAKVPGLTVEGAFSLATLDNRMRASAGKYLYLADWGNPRRETISSAVEHVVRLEQGPKNVQEIVTLVQERIGRACERADVVACLDAIGATVDSDGMCLLAQDAAEPILL